MVVVLSGGREASLRRRERAGLDLKRLAPDILTV
jgi:hypothetical protein